MSIKALAADHLLLGKVKLFYYFLLKASWKATYLLTFFSSHTISNILFKGLKSFRNLFWFYYRDIVSGSINIFADCTYYW